METCFNYCSKDEAFFSSDERMWINRIRKLKEEHPDEVIILKQPEENDGCIYCKLPASTLQIKFKRVMSEEEMEIRMKTLNKINNRNSEENETDLAG